MDIDTARIDLERRRTRLEEDRAAWMKDIADGRAALVKDRACLEEDRADQRAEFERCHAEFTKRQAGLEEIRRAWLAEFTKRQAGLEETRRAWLAEVEDVKASLAEEADVPPPWASPRSENRSADKLKKFDDLQALCNKLEEEREALCTKRAELETELAQLQVVRAGLEEEERAVEREPTTSPLAEARLQRLEEAVFKMNVSVEEEEEPWYFDVVRAAILERLRAQDIPVDADLTIARRVAVSVISIIHGAVKTCTRDATASLAGHVSSADSAAKFLGIPLPSDETVLAVQENAARIKSWLREYAASLAPHPQYVFDVTKSLFENYAATVAEYDFMCNDSDIVLNELPIGNSSNATRILLAYAKVLRNDRVNSTYTFHKLVKECA